MIKKFIYLFTLTILLLLLQNVSGQEISTIGQIYDFDIGDEFHSYEYLSASTSGYEVFKSHYIIDKYYSTDSNTVFYEIFQSRLEHFSWSEPTYSEDTITYHYENLDSLIMNGNIDSVVSNQNLYNGRTINYYHSTEERLYVKGCGEAYYFIEYEGTTQYITLVYYIKDEEEWGEPLLILNVPRSKESELLTIYPNPTKDILNIKVSILNCYLRPATLGVTFRIYVI